MEEISDVSNKEHSQEDEDDYRSPVTYVGDTGNEGQEETPTEYYEE